MIPKPESLEALVAARCLLLSSPTPELPGCKDAAFFLRRPLPWHR